MLLAGESNAFFLQECCLTTAVTVIRVGSIDAWLTSAEFAEKARTPDLIAFLWWQGNSDSAMPVDTYVQKLRSLIAVARSTHPALPVRIIEIPDTSSRASVREAERIVAADEGVTLIPTSDLPFDQDSGHFIFPAYQTVRDRINQSLGR